MAEVRLENITKIFEKNIIGLKDFNLEAKDGEFVTILGPSGSGKSTALRIISGLERQDKGAVFIDGYKVNELPPQKRDVAFVFQSYALYPHMDIYENIAVGLRIKGQSENEIKKRVKEVSELLEIADLLKRRPKALSGGQRQRMALARAIAKRPKIFLLDEPLSNLDAILREKMRAELKLLFKKICGTVIYVTHDQTEAISLSDRIALINEGALEQFGSVDELYYRPKNLFVASFLGSPRLNIFEVLIDQNNFIYKSMRWKVPQEYLSKIKDRDRIVLGVRPEDVRLYLEAKPETFLVQLSIVEKISKFVILNLNWEGENLKAVAERNFVEEINRDRLWVELDMERLYLFDIKTHELL